MGYNQSCEVKTFEGDFFRIFNLLQNGVKFSFSKYADGEYAILRDQRITNCDGWTYDPMKDQKYRYELMQSFRYSDPGYYVGISCPCCVPQAHVEWMREHVGSDEDHLTWANLFVNANYKLFKEYFIPEFGHHDVIVVASAIGRSAALPFMIEDYYGVLKTAWKDNYDLINFLIRRDFKDKLFLFCAGPLGNLLAHRLWDANKNNVYMDIGSTLNPWLVGNNRGYLRGRNVAKKICVW
jgi:hypothetical protein